MIASRRTYADALSYTSGIRECVTEVHIDNTIISPVRNLNAFSTTLLGPATIIWDVHTDPTTPTTTRQVLLRVHPSICLQVHQVLQWAVMHTIGHRDSIARCVNEVNERLTFEITGARATEVVKSVLRPVAHTNKATKQVRVS